MSVPAALNAQAQTESAAFLMHFDALGDPRQPGKVIHPLNEVLLPGLPATLAGAGSFVDIALSGVKKRALLRRFLPFAAGTPSHDHLGDSLCHFGCRMLPALPCRLAGLVHGAVRRRDRH